MKCEDARKQLALLLYGELSFDEEENLETHIEACEGCRGELERERAWQRAFDIEEAPLPPGMAARSRRELMASVANARARLGFWERLSERLGMRWRFVHPALQPLGAVALLLLGYFGSRVYSPAMSGRFDQSSTLAEPVASRVRYVEPEASGQVRIVVEEARQRVLTGKVDDEKIRQLLVAATQDPADPGLRVESVDLLKGQMESVEVRRALLYSVEHDPNAGVRLKALDGLKTFASDPQTRQVLTQVLLKDKNPGVRTQVIDLLIQHKGDQMVGVLQQLMHTEDNGYVRLRCQRALHDLNASEGTF